MGGAERVIGTFDPPGEPGQPLFLPQGMHARAASGQDFVGIALVTNVPDQPVVGRVEHVMQGNG